MKIIISEEQLKKIIIPNQLNESSEIMGLKDLADVVGRLGFDEEGIKILHKMFVQAYKHSGDEGVVDMFKDATNLNIEPISKAKYIFSYN